jgi:hypothetical protein
VAKTQPLVEEIIKEVGGEARSFYEAILAGKAAFAAKQAAEAASAKPADQS